MYNTTGERIKDYILNILAKYLVWLIIGIVLIIWLFFPSLVDTLGKILIFWAPVIIIIIGAMAGFGKIAFMSKRNEAQGIYQYDISITKTVFYLIDIIIYGGTLLILIFPAIFTDLGTQPIDLMQALIFFIFSNWIKQIFYKKILR